jgi:rhamnogalacturonyl hydrolase YesR
MHALRCKAGWAQWFDPTRKRNNDVAWSRGMGWAVLGLLDLVHMLDGGGCAEVADLAAEVMERLAQAQVLNRARAACQRAVGDDGTYNGVTADVLPSWDIETYEHCPTEPSPWAQGSAVRAFAALAREALGATS